MFFASDNSGPVHPKVMTAIAAANAGYATAYGVEPEMDIVRSKLRDLLNAPEAAVYLVATGTAANSLALATLSNPWDTIFCSKDSHIHEDECNAPEFFTGGAKLTVIDSPSGKITADALTAAIEGEETRGVHGPQRGPVSLTTVTERGTIYTQGELKALTDVAKSYDLPVHLDGARFANAVVAGNHSPADITTHLGMDALSFGGTKNGLMGVEAVVLFDPDKAWEFELRRKRSAHLFSKHRYLSAQMNAYLTDDLWRQTARAANDACSYFVDALKGTEAVRFEHEPQANIIFARMPRAVHQRLNEAGRGLLHHGWSARGAATLMKCCWHGWYATGPPPKKKLIGLSRWRRARAVRARGVAIRT